MVGKIYFHPDDLFFRMCCFFRDGSLVGVVLVLISVGLLGGLFAVVARECKGAFKPERLPAALHKGVLGKCEINVTENASMIEDSGMSAGYRQLWTDKFRMGAIG